MRVQSLGQEDSLEKEMATHSSILAWKNPVDRRAWWATVQRITKNQTQQLTTHTHTHTHTHGLSELHLSLPVWVPWMDLPPPQKTLHISWDISFKIKCQSQSRWTFLRLMGIRLSPRRLPGPTQAYWIRVYQGGAQESSTSKFWEPAIWFNPLIFQKGKLRPKRSKWLT